MEKEYNDNGKFLKGLLCGVVLTLVCLALSLAVQQRRLNRQLLAMYEEADKNQTGDISEENSLLELDEETYSDKISEIEDIINQNFRGEIDAKQVEDQLYSGLVEGLDDPYSEYYSAESLRMLEESTSGSYSGIGAILSQDPQTGVIMMLNCFPDAPAAEAGMLPGDILSGINGETIGDMDLTEVVSKIKTEPGEYITLQVLRDGEEMEMQMARRDVEVPTVSVEMLDGKIGYLQILEFDDVTLEQVQDGLSELEAQGMEKLIVDLRDNPGGVLQVVSDVLDLFLPEGLTVYMEDKAGRRTEYYSDEEHQFTKPLAVLTNENSASAAEIFAGAVKDYGIGVLVGTTTFGKGVVQRIFTLSDGTGVKLTIAKYYTPKGTDIHEKGITPDVEVELDEALEKQLLIEKDEDNQLQEAIRQLADMS